MHIFGMINAFICINNHVISCINSMLSKIIKHCKGDVPSLTYKQHLELDDVFKTCDLSLEVVVSK